MLILKLTKYYEYYKYYDITIKRPHFAKNERLSGAKTGPERVHWGAIKGVSIVLRLCGGAVGVARCPVVWVGVYRDPFFVYFFS